MRECGGAARADPESDAVRWKQLSAGDGARSYALVYETGDEVVAPLERFARELDVTAAGFTAVGALQRAVVGYFDWEAKRYARIPVEEQVELLALSGDIALADGVPAVHAHVVLGRRDGTTRGGHLLEAIVRPTLELILTEAPAHLVKRSDPETGLALIDPLR
jgi:hypothetical protein